MATVTARVPVLMTEAEKSRIVAKAQRAGLSTGEYMRRAAQSFRLSEDDKIMEGMIDQMLKATERAERAIEDTLEYVAASNERIAAMEARKEVS